MSSGEQEVTDNGHKKSSQTAETRALGDSNKELAKCELQEVTYILDESDGDSHNELEKLDDTAPGLVGSSGKMNQLGSEVIDSHSVTGSETGQSLDQFAGENYFSYCTFLFRVISIVCVVWHLFLVAFFLLVLLYFIVS
jgi:hypothetical protein